MYPSLVTPDDHLICLPCAKDAHTTAGTFLPADLYERPIFGECASCGCSTQLLPARLFGVAAPGLAVRKFALAVQGTLYQMAGWGLKIQAVRARHDSGSYWVDIVPRAGITVRLAATRSRDKAIGRFVQTIGQLHPQITF